MGISQYLMGNEQTESAPSAPPAYSRELERQARSNGFKSAEEMMLWAKQRNQPSGGTVSGSGKPSVEAAMSWHPAVIFNHLLGKWKSAEDGQ